MAAISIDSTHFNFQEFEDMCYTINLQPKTFEEAKNSCISSGSELANISSV